MSEQKQPKPKRESKADRWSRLCGEAKSALEEMEEMRQEWADTFDNMNEGLQQSPYGEKLSAMNDLDLQSAIDTVDEAEGCDVPLGFGRD